MTKLLVLVPLALGACADLYLPRPQTPARVIPEVPIEPAPPVADQGRISFDVVDGPARVEEVLATETFRGQYVSAVAERTRHVCDTPCASNLPFGTYKLRFSTKDGLRVSEENVVIGKHPTVYRYATGSNQMPVGKVWGTAGLIVAGIAAGGIALGGYATGNTGLGHAFLAIGFGFEIGGIALFQTARRWRQHGAPEQWTPSSGDIYTVR
jgi:hypothetical protein